MNFQLVSLSLAQNHISGLRIHTSRVFLSAFGFQLTTGSLHMFQFFQFWFGKVVSRIIDFSGSPQLGISQAVLSTVGFN
jgi:hypothetical protein